MAEAAAAEAARTSRLRAARNARPRVGREVDRAVLFADREAEVGRLPGEIQVVGRRQSQRVHCCPVELPAAAVRYRERARCGRARVDLDRVAVDGERVGAAPGHPAVGRGRIVDVPVEPDGQAERRPEDPAHRPAPVVVPGHRRQQPVALDDVGGLMLQPVCLQDRERLGRELPRIDPDRDPVERDRPRPAAGHAAVVIVGVADRAVERDPEAAGRDHARARRHEVVGERRQQRHRPRARAEQPTAQVGDGDRRRQR